MEKVFNVRYWIPYSTEVFKHFDSEAAYTAWLDSMGGILFRRAEYVIVTGYDDAPIMSWYKGR